MIIALSGIPGVGKDTIAQEVQERLNTHRLGFNPRHPQFEKGFSIKKFAGVGNEVYNKITGVNYSNLSREEKEKHRPQFIAFAEKMKEVFGEDIWAKGLMDKRTEQSNNWIITDLRYPEELAALQEFEDVFLFRIRRKCDECGLMETHGTFCSHQNITPKEIKLAGYYGWDGIVYNDSTITYAGNQIVTHILEHYNQTV